MNDADLDLDLLAESIASLSHADALPTTFADRPNAFEPDEVDWSTSSWISLLLNVQGWLHLDSMVEEGPPETVMQELFEELGASNPGSCFTVGDDGINLTERGFALLESRVSDAVERKTLFEERLASRYTVNGATLEWQDAWDQVEPPGLDEAIQVTAEVDTWKIKDFRDYAEGGTLELNPSYQRDAVWSRPDSQLLVDSVLRAIPLPSIILNKNAEEDETLEIVDGKQRLTAILRFIGHHPDGRRYAERVSEGAPAGKGDYQTFEKDYRAWRKYHSIKTSDENDYFLPFALKKYGNDDPLHVLGGKYYCEIRDERIKVRGSLSKISTLFEGPSDYLIPVIKYQATELQQIHRVFGLYNKQGKHLNAEELRNAIFHHLDITKLLLVLSGDNDDVDLLAPYLSGTRIDTDAVHRMLYQMNVSRNRYHYSKIVGWVFALLLHPTGRKSDRSGADGGVGRLKTPSTSKLIDGMLTLIGGSPGHRMHSEEHLVRLARDLVAGASLWTAMSNTGAIHPAFTSKTKPGVKWEDLSAVSVITAATLAAISGATEEDVDQSVDAIRAFTMVNQPLDKQQTATQWDYLRTIVPGLLEAMGIDLERLQAILLDRYGYSCLDSLTTQAA